jgi:uncharacterized protein
VSLALIGAGLLMGLAGSPHCALMCGAPCAAVVRSCGGDRPARALWAWHLGRVFAYAAAGAISAASVGFVAQWSGASALLRPVWTMLEAAVLITGLMLLWSGRMPRWIDATAHQLGHVVRLPAPLSRREGVEGVANAGPRRAGLIGLAWVGMPCGLLWGALAVAVLADGALQGAAVMASFALGSAIGLVGAPWLWARLLRLPHAGALRLAGALLAGGSAWALGQGFDAASAWCVTA